MVGLGGGTRPLTEAVHSRSGRHPQPLTEAVHSRSGRHPQPLRQTRQSRAHLDDQDIFWRPAHAHPRFQEGC